jgi:hypothetical protein
MLRGRPSPPITAGAEVGMRRNLESIRRLRRDVVATDTQTAVAKRTRYPDLSKFRSAGTDAKLDTV